jgi:hypothetical protein
MEECSTPIEPGLGNGSKPPQAAGEQLQERTIPPRPPPRLGALTQAMSQRRPRRRTRRPRLLHRPEKTQRGAVELRPSLPSPRPARKGEPHTAQPPPLSLATTAGREWKSSRGPSHHGCLLRRLLEAHAHRRQVVELQERSEAMARTGGHPMLRRSTVGDAPCSGGSAAAEAHNSPCCHSRPEGRATAMSMV